MRWRLSVQVLPLLLAAAYALLLQSGDAGQEPSSSPAGEAKAIPKYRLNDGKEIPALGLGVYRVRPGRATYDAVKSALELGYRMIDTAAFYGNEADVGRAVRDSGIPRSEIFITSKLTDSDHGYQRALAAGHKSTKALGLDYIDLYLIHTPGAFSFGGGKIVETYDALLDLKKQGIVRSVGVSNFDVPHLQALRKYGRPAPAVNQFEIHPLVWEDRKDLVKYCRDSHILVQAYGSVLRGHKDLMQRAAAAPVAAHGKTPAQVLLRWALQQGFQVIPKSVHRERQAENMDVFDFSLSDAEIVSLNQALPVGRLKLDYWNPLTTKVDLGVTRPA